MGNAAPSRLLLKTYDGSLSRLYIKPNYTGTKVAFDISYYGEEGTGALQKGKIVFTDVVSVDIEVNYFDNYTGAELLGFYEICDAATKRFMLEKVFCARRDGYLLPGDYDYDVEDEADILNNRAGLEGIEKELERYHLYQQQTMGGIYYILAGGYELQQKESL